MTLKSDANFKEKLICSFKYDIRNLMNFHTTTQKSENFTLMGSFYPKVYKVWAKKTEELSFMTLNSDEKFEKTLTLWFRKWHEELGELSFEHSKVWKTIFWWALFLKTYVSARKFERNYVSWNWKVMQNLKEN